MGEYEPNDSRNVTQTKSNVPGEPERTGPHEGETRDQRRTRTRARSSGADTRRAERTYHEGRSRRPALPADTAVNERH